MDKVKVRQLELEVEEINRVQDEGEDLNTPDGFIKVVKKQLHKICSKKYEKKTAGASSFPDRTKPLKGEGDADIADVYDFSHPERGLAIIISNEDFSSPGRLDRPESSYDAMALYETFTNLGFRVWVKKNLKSWQMEEVLKSGRDDYDHANADCFVCAILTHGNQEKLPEGDDSLGLGVWKHVLLGTDRKTVPTSTVVHMFSDFACEKLEGKPRRDDYDHANADCFVCAILTHGNQEKLPEGDDSLGLGVWKHVLLGTDRKTVPTSTVVHMFSDFACEKLEGKPRLFFIQACRGDKYDDGVTILVTKGGQQSFCGTDHGSTQDGSSGSHSNPEASSSSYSPTSQTDATDAKPEISQETIEEGLHNVTLNATSSEGIDTTDAPVRDIYVCPTPLYKDSLIMYATPPGYFAWRRKTGAWLVQSLCCVLNNSEIGSRSLLSALVQVVGMVARDYQSYVPSNPYMHQKKEVPVIESMLVKDVIFAPK